MELASNHQDLLGQYLRRYQSLIGDRRTWKLFRGTMQGIIGAESLKVAQIVSHSPELSGARNSAQRIRRMARGETTRRSYLDSEHLVEKLQAHAVEQLAGEDDLWVILDPSELRKPYANEMQYLMKVRQLKGEGTVSGYRTLNALGVGRGGRRGILYHRLFSSHADDFLSESKEIQGALNSVGQAVQGQERAITYVMDSQFDDEAVWGTIWEQGNHLLCRLKHQKRLVLVAEPSNSAEVASVYRESTVEQAKAGLRELARLRTQMLVRKRGQRYQKRQSVTVIVSACPIRVRYQVDVRTRSDGPIREKDVYLVMVQLENVETDPWLLLTDWPVEDEQDAERIYRMYRERWAIEDAFKFSKDVLGWEGVQLLDFEAVRTLVAMSWVAAGFLYQLGITLEWPEIRLLARLGGWEERQDRKPGKTVITRGLQRLLDHMVTETILNDEIAAHGQLPPRIAAFLNIGKNAPS